MSDTVRTLGFDTRVEVAGSIVPIAYSTSSTAIPTLAIDTRNFPRARFLIILQNASDSTSTGVTPAVQEGATSSPTTPVTTTISGTMVASDGVDSCQFVSYRRNAAKPYFRALLTPAGGSGVVSGVVLAIYDGL